MSRPASFVAAALIKWTAIWGSAPLGKVTREEGTGGPLVSEKEGKKEMDAKRSEERSERERETRRSVRSGMETEIEEREAVDDRDKRLREKVAEVRMTEARKRRDNFSRDLRARRLYLYPKPPYYWITPADVNVSYAGLRRPAFLFRGCPASIPPTRCPENIVVVFLSRSRRCCWNLTDFFNVTRGNGR